MKTLIHGNYIVEEIGSTLRDWKYLTPSSYAHITDDDYLKGIEFTLTMIEFLQDLDISKSLPEHLTDATDINKNLRLGHKGHIGDKSNNVSFNEWKHHQFFYASQLNTSDRKKSTNSYFLGQILHARVVLARAINNDKIEVENKDEAIEILIGLEPKC